MPTKPNVIYILADDMGYGDVRYLNPDCRIPTPHLDRLGREGMAFTDAHSSSSVCTPSRYSILTGRYCWRTYIKRSVLNGTSPALIDNDRPTLATLAREQDYRTACIGKWHLGWSWACKPGMEADIYAAGEDMNWIDYSRPIEGGPLDCGFEHFYGISASLDMPPYVYVEGDRPVEEPTAWGSVEEFGRAGPRMESLKADHVLGHITDKALEWLGEQSSDQPFLLYFPLTAPHTPIAPAPEFVGRSTLGSYGDFCMEVDHRVGQILDRLDQLGLREDTMVIFTTDNGASQACNPEALKEKHGHRCSHIYRGYKSDIWDGGHRIPYLLRWPAGVKEGTFCDHPIGIFDTIATLKDLWGQSDVHADAHSFLPCFNGEAPAHRLMVHHSIHGMFALRQNQWKLCRCPGSGGWSHPDDREATEQGLYGVQLYDLHADPEEQENLAAHHPEQVEAMTRELHGIVFREDTLKPDRWDQVNWLPEIPEHYVIDD